jgi:hypothetical protein
MKRIFAVTLALVLMLAGCTVQVPAAAPATTGGEAAARRPSGGR